MYTVIVHDEYTWDRHMFKVSVALHVAVSVKRQTPSTAAGDDALPALSWLVLMPVWLNLEAVRLKPCHGQSP